MLRTIARLILLALPLVVALGPGSARAQKLAEAVTLLLEDSFGSTATAIELVAGSGAPHAADAIEALGDRRLLASASEKSVLVRRADGRHLDLASGQPVAAIPSDAAPVRVNNRLRAAIEAALGGLTLKAPDRARRLQAAEAIFKSRDAAKLPQLEAAIAAESDHGVRGAMELARASILLADPTADPVRRIAAIRTLRDSGDQDALRALRTTLPTLKDGSLISTAEEAINAIERHLQLVSYVQNIWYGLSLGSVLLLAAIGLAITFGVMGVINMAHGEMVMLGAYTTFVVQEAFRSYAPGYVGWTLALAIPLAFLVAAAVGVLIERGVIRFLYGRPLETLLATWGVSLILQQTVRTIFGPTNREVASPGYMSGAFEIAGMAVTWGRLWIIVFTLVVFALLLLVLKATPLGLQMRAVTQNRRMAAAMGIRTPYVDAMTFALGSGVAGVAGVALSQIDNVSPNLGQAYIVDSFMVVVFGGVGNLWGTFVSAFALGIANKLLEPVAGAVLAKIAILALLILFIQKRPRGLFALKGRAVEA